MFTFVVRPAYKKPELLIEFRAGSGNDEMFSTLKKILSDADIEPKRKIDLWQNDEIIYEMSGALGDFELSADNWGCVFIMAPKNQPAIKLLEILLIESKLFEAEVVDHARYT